MAMLLTPLSVCPVKHKPNQLLWWLCSGMATGAFIGSVLQERELTLRKVGVNRVCWVVPPPQDNTLQKTSSILTREDFSPQQPASASGTRSRLGPFQRWFWELQRVREQLWIRLRQREQLQWQRVQRGVAQCHAGGKAALSAPPQSRLSGGCVKGSEILLSVKKMLEFCAVWCWQLFSVFAVLCVWPTYSF